MTTAAYLKTCPAQADQNRENGQKFLLELIWEIMNKNKWSEFLYLNDLFIGNLENVIEISGKNNNINIESHPFKLLAKYDKPTWKIQVFRFDEDREVSGWSVLRC